MKRALQIFGVVILTICALSITVHEKTIFAYMYDVISPATKMAQRGTISAFHYSADKVRVFTKQIFDNSVPKADSVKSKFSAPSRSDSVSAPAEHIETHEKEQLDDLIKSSASHR
jgi:hypothetical protein